MSTSTEPSPTTTENSKFKVGDRVRSNCNHEGVEYCVCNDRVGTVFEVSGDGYYIVDVPELGVDGLAGYHEDELELYLG